jgi:histidine triad (HIT) family protein
LYTHAPADYVCPFCPIVAGADNPSPYTQQSDVVYRDQHTTAFVTVHWYPNNPGHVLVIPNRHIENIYSLTPDIAAHVHEASRQIALAMKQAYGCDGISTRQHNEPAGSQYVWHYHLHIFPRFAGDRLYDLAHQHRMTTPAERLPYAEQLRSTMGPGSLNGPMHPSTHDSR